MINENAIPRCSKICCRTRRCLAPGEVYYSALVEEPEGIVRLDFSPEAWREEQKNRPADRSGGQPAMIGWWKAVLPAQDDKKVRLAPNDILFNLFDQWLADEEKGEYLYILSLLMVRRRILRMERGDSESASEMTVYAPRREISYVIPIHQIAEERISELQETFARLIFPAP